MSIKNKYITGSLLTLGFIIILVAVFFETRAIQNLRNKASSLFGDSTITLTSDPDPITVGNGGQINLGANLPNEKIDALQVVATISGTIPKDLFFEPATSSATEVVYNRLTFNSTSSATIKLAYVSKDPTQPLNGSTFDLGHFSFTPSDPGEMDISFDNDLSKIVQNKSSLDILLPLNTTKFKFVISTPTPSPTPTPTESPSPTPTATPNWCNGTCGSNYNCQGGLFCSNGFCRNPDCPSDNTCGCATPTPTPKLASNVTAPITTSSNPAPTSLAKTTPVPTSSFGKGVLKPTTPPTPKAAITPAHPLAQYAIYGGIAATAIVVIVITIFSIL